MTDVDPRLIEQAIARAKAAAQRAYANYSHFPVGAAVISDAGIVVDAPNIENASYSLTICAERNAIFHAVSAGHLKIHMLVMYTPTSTTHTPCGACRQVLAEFGSPDTTVLCLSDGAPRREFTLDQLLPCSFTL
jgi:cytidine deaminase